MEIDTRTQHLLKTLINHHIADMAEKNGKLRMRYDNVYSISEALELLNAVLY
mgnify:CR=1 FL=1